MNKPKIFNNLSLSPLQQQQVLEYVKADVEGNQRMRLTGIQDPNEIIDKLVIPTLNLGVTLPSQGDFLDIGSGAGNPGLLLKIIHPRWRGVLVERSHKKARFLQELVIQFGYDEMEVVPRDFREFALKCHAPFDFVFSRGVRIEESMIPLIFRCLRVGGRYFFYGERNVPVVKATTENADFVLSQSVEGWREVKRSVSRGT